MRAAIGPAFLSLTLGTALVVSGLVSAASTQPSTVNRTAAALMAFEDLVEPAPEDGTTQAP